jgi:hypothetical protein
MAQELNVRLIEAADRMIEYHDKVFEVVHKLESQSMSRIVWLVAIAGFALINFPGPTAQVATSLPSILAPWIITSLLGVITHWEFRNKSVKNLELYMTKRELLMAFVANGPTAATMAELNSIIRHEKEPLTARLAVQSRITRVADLLEFATLISFVLAMGLTLLRVLA